MIDEGRKDAMKLVMKFGGTSVGDMARIRHAAAHVKREAEAGCRVAVIVSAMAGETDRLNALAQSAGKGRRERDVVVAAGEQVSAGLMALALRDMGLQARSWLGWQIPIRTDDAPADARIGEIDAEEVAAAMDGGEIAVIAGFQGVCPEGRITTLGRGGSDISAVALAAALDAERCDIYTDVDGVYSTDPNIVPEARKLPRIAYEEMLEMASLGAKVLHTRSVGLAMAHRVPLRVRSSFAAPEEDVAGTLICEEDDGMESEIVHGIAYTRNEAKITLRGVVDAPGVAARIFGPLAEAGINVDMIVQNVSDDGRTDVTFTMPSEEEMRALAVIEGARAAIGCRDVQHTPDMAKISVIGVGMRSHSGVAQTMFRELAEKDINIHVISTSEIKVSVLIDAAAADEAVRTLHAAYGLEQAEQD